MEQGCHLQDGSARGDTSGTPGEGGKSSMTLQGSMEPLLLGGTTATEEKGVLGVLILLMVL